MNHGVPVGRSTRTTWESTTREIAVALGIPLQPRQWVVLENGDDDGASLPLTETVHVVVWDPALPSEYHKPELIADPERYR